MAEERNLEKWLGGMYHSAYDAICGKHPRLRPWHSEWLAARDLYADLRRILPTLQGSILDVGCGDKPYREWATKARNYVGIDVYAGARVDVVTKPCEAWPFEDHSFDHVLCTQVLEHVSNLEYALAEIRRVLKPGGQLVVTVPFIFQEHGTPNDYRRFSIYGARQLFPESYQVAELKLHGGIGTAVGLLGLGWIDIQTRRWTATRALKGVCLPLWIAFCGLVNVFGYLLDKVDRTQAFYTNLLILARKPS